MLLVHNALLLTMGPLGEASGWMLVGDDGRIAAIGPGAAPPAAAGTEIVDVHGAFVAPGFVSAHSHLFTSVARGLGMDQALYGWINASLDWTRRATPEDMYFATLHGALDFLNNGITTAYDFTNGRLTFDLAEAGFRGSLRPAAHVEAQLTAKIDAGIRSIHSVLLDEAAGERAEILERIERMVEHGRRFESAPEMLGMALSGAVQWAPDRTTADLEAEVMDRYGFLNQAHFLETAERLDHQHQRFAWYQESGAFGPNLIFGHFVHATEAQMTAAAGADCAMVWQPASNGRLASGIAPIRRLRELGMRIGVGLDDQSCTDISDPFQNLRMGIYMQRAAHRDPAAMPVRDMLELHTIGSARVLGVADHVGSLEVGKWADFLIVDPRSPDTGPVWDPIGTYVLACGLRNLKQVRVGGRLVSQDGVIVSVDGAAVSGEAHSRLSRLMQAS